MTRPRLKRQREGTAHLDDRVWQELKGRLADLARPHVRVGVLASKGGSAAAEGSAGITMAELATVHEYGSPEAGIPARSFVRRTFIEKEADTAGAIAKLAGRVIEGKVDEGRALELLGAWGAAQVKNTIARGPHIPPPLKPETIEAKSGKTRPLVDSGQLVGSISSEVVDG